MPASTSEPTRIRRAYRWIVAVVVILFLILTGFWFYAASELDRAVTRAIEQAEARGVAISCPGQDVVGYPFRIGLVCDEVAVSVPRERFSFAAGPLRSAAQIYQPNRIVSELGSPVRFQNGDGPPIELTWDLGQASASFWTEGLDHASVATEAPRVSVGGEPSFSAEGGQLHVRRREGDLDIAGRQISARLDLPQAAAVPRFDLGADLTIDGAADWLSGEAPGETLGELLAGQTGTLRALDLVFEGEPAGADLSGDFSFSEGGLLSGTFDLAVTAPDRLASIIGGVAPDAASIVGTIASVIPYVGETENGRTVIRVTANDGQLSAGVIPLGRIPPLE